jgi:integrase
MVPGAGIEPARSNLWHIPAERMKRNKDHIIPLSPQCVTLLKLMKQISGNRTFVFPSDRDPRKHANSQTANTALKRMGFDKQLLAHGMLSALLYVNSASWDRQPYSL